MNIIDTIQSLYKDYGQLKGVTIECQKELVAIGIKNQAATAEVFIQGAQITRYQGIDESPTLFLSKACDYKKGSALRGGIPICWPWFGDLAKNPEAVKQQLTNDDQVATKTEFPAHGFVRQRDWTVDSIRTPADDLTIVELSYHVKDEPLWPFDTLLTCRISIGAALSVSLHIANNSSQAVVFSAALHSYFAVNHIDNVRISGFNQSDYYDALDVNEKNEWPLKTQQGDITFSKEVDRVYQSSNTPVTINEKNRTRRITSLGSDSTVVWNPWVDKSQELSQYKGDDYQRMVCVETANAVNDVIHLESGENHKLELTVSAG
jgi:glucose-6-phosphate 1-epimerase